MKNYLKDKKAQAYKRVVSLIDGFNTTAYYPVEKQTLWVYAKQLTQDQVYAAAAAGRNETRFFVFTNCIVTRKLKLYDLIGYRGEYYEITRIDTADDYAGDMYIYVKLCDKKPNVKDYDPDMID